MRIALIVHDLLDGIGHGYYSRVLADALAAEHEVVAFANRLQAPGAAGWVGRRVPAWRPKALATVLTFPLGLRRFRRELEIFDIRHSQGYCGGVPNVCTAHICTAAYRDSLVDVSPSTRLSLGVMARRERAFYRRFRGTVIAISRKVADELRGLYGVEEPIEVIPHGVDPQRFSPAQRSRFREPLRRELGVGGDETVALYVGDLAKAHAHLRELSRAAPEVRFWIVSRSPGYRWQAPNVDFLGPRERVEEVYAAADAFLFPSTYDAFGMVVLEAMASGLATFSSDQAGAAELLAAGEGGRVAPLSDWVEVCREALGDRERLTAQGVAAAEAAGAWGWAEVARRVEAVYLRQLAREGEEER